jgi:FAD dependent monooxygenase
MERRLALEILYENLPDKSKIVTGKRVKSVNETEDGVRVTFQDGSFEEGDIVVGADGVHSIVRNAMWEMASKLSPELIPSSERNCKNSY